MYRFESKKNGTIEAKVLRITTSARGHTHIEINNEKPSRIGTAHIGKTWQVTLIQNQSLQAQRAQFDPVPNTRTGNASRHPSTTASTPSSSAQEKRSSALNHRHDSDETQDTPSPPPSAPGFPAPASPTPPTPPASPAADSDTAVLADRVALLRIDSMSTDPPVPTSGPAKHDDADFVFGPSASALFSNEMEEEEADALYLEARQPRQGHTSNALLGIEPPGPTEDVLTTAHDGSAPDDVQCEIDEKNSHGTNVAAPDGVQGAFGAIRVAGRSAARVLARGRGCVRGRGLGGGRFSRRSTMRHDLMNEDQLRNALKEATKEIKNGRLREARKDTKITELKKQIKNEANRGFSSELLAARTKIAAFHQFAGKNNIFDADPLYLLAKAINDGILPLNTARAQLLLSQAAFLDLTTLTARRWTSTMKDWTSSVVSAGGFVALRALDPRRGPNERAFGLDLPSERTIRDHRNAAVGKDEQGTVGMLDENIRRLLRASWRRGMRHFALGIDATDLREKKKPGEEEEGYTWIKDENFEDWGIDDAIEWVRFDFFLLFFVFSRATRTRSSCGVT